MSAPSTDPGESYSGPRVLKSDPKLTPRQIVVNVLVCGAFVVFWLVWTGTWPLPRGEENSDQASEFLKQEFPDRALQPDAHEDSTGPVAALFYLIQSGDAPDATKAVQFATEQNLGYASPYVIERLESDSPSLRQAARQFLHKMAGQDLGPDPQPWQAWWRDPPRRLLGIVTVGHHLTQVGIPIVGGLLGVLLLSIGIKRQEPGLSTIGTLLLAVGWFLIFSTAGMLLVGSVNTVTFGGTEILYYTDHGVVEGLSDARAGGMPLFLMLCLLFVAAPLIVLVGVFVIYQWWKSLWE
ncbi:hypothetical protein Pan153_19280 [Gimesia panareensis]|uniref:Uncharacterized protein n=1 Tax=Gimesia panareensis TaxID=2527978 RepID=A0A518FLR4_9PLAN|nr:hypothetical protein [Gimesia panareensis]QDV17293.1 hypothetical protein Pan153_19280 [Gimesia panareensis]